MRSSDNGPSSDPLTAAQTPCCEDCGFDVCTCDQERHYGWCICEDCQ